MGHLSKDGGPCGTSRDSKTGDGEPAGQCGGRRCGHRCGHSVFSIHLCVPKIAIPS